MIRADEGTDLALLRVPGVGHPCLAGAPPPPIGAELYVIGSPLSPDLGATVTRGIASGMRRVGETVLVQTDASINPGNSGGPMIDAAGRVTGIVTAKLVGESIEGIGFGIPWDQLAGALDIRWSDRSDTDLDGAKGLRPRDPDPDPAGAEPDPTPPPLEPLNMRFVGVGGVLGAGGAITVASTSLWYLSDPQPTDTTWRAVQQVNLVGWIGLLGGSAMIVGEVVSNTHKRREQRAERRQ